ncbi:hypothetical protein PMAYCL1PPCAC_24520, partial [Pristionchus mayeri]
QIWRDTYHGLYKLREETTDSEEYLKWFSDDDHSKYCLSYAFTYRDFKDDIQGLAYPCFLFTSVKAKFDKRTYNTGLVTFKSGGNPIPQAK